MRLTAARLIIGIVGCFASSSASADPITFTYQITNLVRCEHTGFVNCVRLPQTFPLTMTIDSVGREDEFGDHSYGEPRFSAIPLTPPIPDGALQTDVFTHHFWNTDDPDVLARAMIDYRFGDQFWFVEMFGAQVPDHSPFVFSATSFARQLYDFNYSFSAGAQDIRYRGDATLLDAAAPVPEPASLVLLGTGLFAIGARARRRHKIA